LAESLVIPFTGFPPFESHPGAEAEQSLFLCYPAQGCQTTLAVMPNSVNCCHAGYHRVAAAYQLQQLFHSLFAALY